MNIGLLGSLEGVWSGGMWGEQLTCAVVFWIRT